ncbi:unnamed protein product [Ectocarpus fasciculatus]
MTDKRAAAAKPADDGKERAVMTKIGRRSDFGWEDRGWKFTLEELANPPSVDESNMMGHGNYDLWKAEQLQYDKEHRAQAHGLMLEICKRLTVKAVVIVGAMTIYQRFLALVSFTKINLHDTAAAAILLASKVEDYKFHIQYVLRETNEVANYAIFERPENSKNSEAYKRFKGRVAKVENKIMSALGFDFLIEHAYPHATDLILHLRGMGWVPERKVALISKGCCHLLSQSLKWTMCLEYPPTFRARLATYLSLLVNHVQPPPSGEWTEILQFKDPGQLKRATAQWLETLDDYAGKTGTRITRQRVVEALAAQKTRDDEQRRKSIASALDQPPMTTHKTVDGRRPSMPPPPPKVPLSHSRGTTGGDLTCGKVSTKDGSSYNGQQRASFSSKPPTHASTSKRKRLEAGAGTTNDTTEKRPRPRPPQPRGLPPSNARSSSSWSSMSGPPATTKQPKTCTPRPPSTPKPRPPTTPKPRPPTTPKPRPPATPKPRPPNTPTPRPPNTPKPRPPTTPKPRPPTTPKPHPPATPKPVKMTLTARPPSTPKPRPPTTPKPLKTSTPLPPNTPKPLKSFTSPPTNAPKPSLTLAARPPSTSKPRPPTTPKPRQPNTPNLLKKSAPRPPSTPKPIRMPITPPPPCTPKPPVTPTPRMPSAPKPAWKTSCTGPTPLSIPKGFNPVAPAGSPRLPSYGKAPRPPSTARPSPLGKAPPAKKPKSPPCPCLSAKTRLNRADSVGASALTKTGAALDSADGKRPRNGGSSQIAFKAKGDASIETNADADSTRGGGLDDKAMHRIEPGMLAQDGRDNRKRSRDESTEDTSTVTQGSEGKRPKTSSDSEGASGSEGDSTSTSSPGKADDTEDDEIEEGEIVEMANQPVMERACAA